MRVSSDWVRLITWPVFWHLIGWLSDAVIFPGIVMAVMALHYMRLHKCHPFPPGDLMHQKYQTLMADQWCQNKVLCLRTSSDWGRRHITCTASMGEYVINTDYLSKNRLSITEGAKRRNMEFDKDVWFRLYANTDSSQKPQKSIQKSFCVLCILCWKDKDAKCSTR